MNLAFDELKEQWRVEKAALELADAQRDIKDVSSNAVHSWRGVSVISLEISGKESLQCLFAQRSVAP